MMTSAFIIRKKIQNYTTTIMDSFSSIFWLVRELISGITVYLLNSIGLLFSIPIELVKIFTRIKSLESLESYG